MPDLQYDRFPVNNFQFTSSEQQVNWKRLESLDVDRIILEKDLQALSSNFDLITGCRLDLRTITPCQSILLSKLFRLSQLGVEFLLHCKTFLQISLGNLESQIRSTKQEAAHYKITTENLLQKLAKKSAVLRGYVNDADFKCQCCEKVFIGSNHLKNHESRRHQDIVFQSELAKSRKSISKAVNTSPQIKLNKMINTDIKDPTLTASEGEGKEMKKLQITRLHAFRQLDRSDVRTFDIPPERVSMGLTPPTSSPCKPNRLDVILSQIRMGDSPRLDLSRFNRCSDWSKVEYTEKQTQTSDEKPKTIESPLEKLLGRKEVGSTNPINSIERSFEIENINDRTPDASMFTFLISENNADETAMQERKNLIESLGLQEDIVEQAGSPFFSPDDIKTEEDLEEDDLYSTEEETTTNDEGDLRTQVEKMFEDKLRSFGIDPSWTRIPYLAWEDKEELRNHAQFLSIKTRSDFFEVRSKLKKEMEERLRKLLRNSF